MIVTRVLAALSAVFWGFWWFGLIDLATVVTRDPDFAEGYLLESGWGLLHLVLLAVPLVALAVRPWNRSAVAVIEVTAVAVLVGSVWGWSGRMLLEGLALVATAVVLGWSRRNDRPTLGRPRPVLLALAVVGLPCALWYAAAWVNAVDDDPWRDDITRGISHYPMQAALALALVGLVAVAAFSGSRLVTVLVAVCALWLGGASIAWPHLDGSLGRPGGALLVVWGLAVVAAGTRTPLAPDDHHRAGGVLDDGGRDRAEHHG